MSFFNISHMDIFKQDFLEFINTTQTNNNSENFNFWWTNSWFYVYNSILLLIFLTTVIFLIGLFIPKTPKGISVLNILSAFSIVLFLFFLPIPHYNAIKNLIWCDYNLYVYIYILISGLFTASFLSINNEITFLKENKHIEYPILILLVFLSGIVVVASENFIAVFLALEAITLISAVLIGFQRTNNFSTLAGVRYIFFSAIPGGALVLGISEIYAYTGAFSFSDIEKLLITYETINVSDNQKDIIGQILFNNLINIFDNRVNELFNCFIEILYKDFNITNSSFNEIITQSQTDSNLFQIINYEFNNIYKDNKFNTLLASLGQYVSENNNFNFENNIIKGKYVLYKFIDISLYNYIAVTNYIDNNEFIDINNLEATFFKSPKELPFNKYSLNDYNYFSKEIANVSEVVNNYDNYISELTLYINDLFSNFLLLPIRNGHLVNAFNDFSLNQIILCNNKEMSGNIYLNDLESLLKNDNFYKYFENKKETRTDNFTFFFNLLTNYKTQFSWYSEECVAPPLLENDIINQKINNNNFIQSNFISSKEYLELQQTFITNMVQNANSMNISDFIKSLDLIVNNYNLLNNTYGFFMPNPELKKLLDEIYYCFTDELFSIVQMIHGITLYNSFDFLEGIEIVKPFPINFLKEYKNEIINLLIKNEYNFVTEHKVSLISINHTTSLPIIINIAVFLVIFYILFKLTAAPFHVWAPSIYEGAPLPITIFLSIFSKITMIFLLIKLLIFYFYFLYTEWSYILIFSGILSIVVGIYGAISETRIKRFFIYSSMGHVGFMLLGIAEGGLHGISATLLYLIIYTITVFIGWSILFSSTNKITHINQLNGLSKINPTLSFILAISMLSMSGIPPLAGFYVKFEILYALVESEFYSIALTALLLTVFSFFYYLRIIKILYFEPIKNYKLQFKLNKTQALLLAICFLILVNFSLYFQQPIIYYIKNIIIQSLY